MKLYKIDQNTLQNIFDLLVKMPYENKIVIEKIGGLLNTLDELKKENKSEEKLEELSSAS